MVFGNASAATLLSMLILGGCAGSTVRIEREPAARPLRVVLAVIPNGIDPAALRRVLAPDVSGDSDEARKLVQSGMAKAEAGVMTEVRNALTKVIGVRVVGSEAVAGGVNDVQINSAEKLRRETANELRLASGADTLLRFRITDYGETPKTWQKWVIGWEVVSTLGVAAIAYASPKARPIAGAYLVRPMAASGRWTNSAGRSGSKPS